MKISVENSPSDGMVSRIALRRRASDHPMAMFAIITSIALSTMAFVPTAGPGLFNPGAPAKIGDDVRTTAKVARLPLNSPDVACHGQTWGDEDEACLATIAQVSGKGDRILKVRRLASAEPNLKTSNIF